MKHFEHIDTALSISGLDFPQTPEHLESFFHVYKDFQFEASPNQIDPVSILKRSRKVEVKVTNVDYHKRTVLAAEIVHQLKGEWSMGRLKLQKLMYLAQETTGMALHANFLKQANGPYDPVLMRSLEAQFKRNKWFTYKPSEKEKYQFLEKAGEHKEWFEKYFLNDKDNITLIIEKFRRLKTAKVEIIGTLYYCWKEILDESKPFSMDLLTTKFYGWSIEKKKFSLEQIEDAVIWMKENKIFPVSKS